MEQETVSIRTAADLFSAVSSRRETVRVPALQAVIRDPSRAYAYGRVDGKDLIDHLLAEASRPDPWRRLVVLALACYRDARTVAFMVEEIATGDSDEMALGLANRLSIEDVAPHRDALRGLLADDRRAARSLAAARLLAGDGTLPLAERLRVALLAGSSEAPPCNETTAAAWLGELSGSCAEAARRLLEQDPACAPLLWRSWYALDETTRVWLVEWSAGACPEHARPALERVLAEPQPLAVRRAALSAAARLGCAVPRLEDFLSDGDADVIAAAVRLGAADAALETWMAPSQPLPVRLAAVRRWTGRRGLEGLPALVARLDDDDWAMRAGVSDALAGLGSDVLEALRPYLADDRPQVRVAAAQVALALGRDDWLEEVLVVPRLRRSAVPTR